MANLQCFKYQEHKKRCREEDQAISDAHVLLMNSHPDDLPNNRSNYDACLKAYRDQVIEKLAHERECEECQREQ